MHERSSGARYVGALREHWLLIFFLVALTTGTAALYSLTAAKRYEASADVLVSPIPPGDETYVGIPVLRESSQSRSVLTAARLVETPEVADAVKEKLNLSESRGQILGAIHVEPQEQSNFVTIVATAGSPEAAARLANAFADELIASRTSVFQGYVKDQIDRLEKKVAAMTTLQIEAGNAAALQERIGELSAIADGPDPTLANGGQAVPPGSAAWPRPALSIAVAFIAALLLGTGAAFALEFFNPRFRREDELVAEQRLPILARIPRMRKRVARDYLTGKEPLPPDVREAFRVLRATVVTAGEDGDLPSSILVTSASPDEGKSMTAVNLAIALATSGLNVILVDGDLRRPMVSTLMHEPARRNGFMELARNGAPVGKILTPARGYGENLRLLVSRPNHEAELDVLRPDEVRRAIQKLEDAAEVVVIDSPPLSEVADALTLAEAAKVVLVAVFLGRTRRDRLVDVRRMLAQVGANVLGFVVVTRSRSRGRTYSYGALAESEPREEMSASGRRAAADAVR
jgi:polysaccharide biosynthesis transport protein